MNHGTYSRWSLDLCNACKRTQCTYRTEKGFNLGFFLQKPIISKSYIEHVSTKQGTQSAEYIQTFRKIGYCSDKFRDPTI